MFASPSLIFSSLAQVYLQNTTVSIRTLELK